MANIVLRVELLGDPDGEVLHSLDAFMAGHGYGRTIGMHSESMPQGMYCGVSTDTARNTAVGLQVSMTTEDVWAHGSIFFAAEYSDWGMAIDNHSL